MLRMLMGLLCLCLPVAAGDRLVVCGAAEVFQIDPAAEVPEKLWSWRAKDCEELPVELRAAFQTTDDCKPLDDGKRMLISSSGGSCAMIELTSGKALWWARVSNAHSIEALPGGRIAVAASIGKSGNKVLLFDEKVPLVPLSELALHSAHGLVWDDSRKTLWALGHDELLACAIDDKTLAVRQRHKLPDRDGHDLRAVPGSAELLFSTHAGVHRFNRDQATFHPDPELKDRHLTKSVDPHPVSGRIVIVQAAGGHWWTDTIELLHPAAKVTLKGEPIYKARWMPLGR